MWPSQHRASQGPKPEGRAEVAWAVAPEVTSSAMGNSSSHKRTNAPKQPLEERPPDMDKAEGQQFFSHFKQKKLNVRVGWGWGTSRGSAALDRRAGRGAGSLDSSTDRRRVRGFSLRMRVPRAHMGLGLGLGNTAQKGGQGSQRQRCRRSGLGGGRRGRRKAILSRGCAWRSGMGKQLSLIAASYRHKFPSPSLQ